MQATGQFHEAATFRSEGAALIACDAACSVIDAIFEPVKEAGVWVVRLTDYVTNAPMGYLFTGA